MAPRRRRQRRRQRRPDWSALPSDAIFAISTHIADDTDHVRFRSVCASFRSAAPKRPQIPYILHLRGQDTDTITLSLGNLPNTDLFPAAALAEDFACRKSFCGSSFGWLALLDDALDISLHNPFTAEHIRLPSLPLAGEYSAPHPVLSKVALSSDPRLPACVAMAMSDVGGWLMCCRSQGDSWTVFPLLVKNGRNAYTEELDDVVHYKGKFYVVNRCEHLIKNANIVPCLFTWEVGSDDFEFSQLSLMRPYTETNYGVRHVRYLVVSSGDLLLVTCSFRDASPESGERSYRHFFEVLRVDLECEGRMSLVKLDSLGGCSIFVGKHGSMSVPPGTSPWCEQNCIYFVLGSGNAKDVLMVYRMEDGDSSVVDCFTNDSFVRSDGMTHASDSQDDQNFGYWEFGWLAPSLC